MRARIVRAAIVNESEIEMSKDLGVVMTTEDAQRIAELLDQAYAADEPIGYALRRIVTEMPHVTSADIQQVIEVRAEEVGHGGGVFSLQSEAMIDIAVIIGSVERISGRVEITTEEAHEILSARAAKGDERAAELLDEFNRVALALEG